MPTLESLQVFFVFSLFCLYSTFEGIFIDWTLYKTYNFQFTSMVLGWDKKVQFFNCNFELAYDKEVHNKGLYFQIVFFNWYIEINIHDYRFDDYIDNLEFK